MCCTTHGYRDSVTPSEELDRLLAADARLACQCKFGMKCRRQATAEDMLCDWCRDIEAGHSIWPAGHVLYCRQGPLLSDQYGVRGGDGTLRWQDIPGAASPRDALSRLLAGDPESPF